MTEKFNLTIFDNRLFFCDENYNYLVDTGSPISINSSEKISFLGKEFEAEIEYSGLKVSDISNTIGYEFHTLLGTDILSEFNVIISVNSKEIIFSDDKMDFSGDMINISKVINIPVIECEILNSTKKMFLDSGAKLSYLNNKSTSNSVSLGKLTDIYPFHGKHDTPIFHLSTKINGSEIFVNYGNLTELHQISLQISDVEGIMGFEFFKNFDVMLDLKNDQIYLSNLYN